ncbi:hypothetical protein PP568_13140 [Mycobacteroides abscessus]|uniref:DUF1127 domain-containing protein n=1 Tax=Mycobacteroides abscessus subsp. abscessus TaxID=1185650 RepID=A0AB38D457_9MYCO|nr:hypothetical protein [Mycobacteroides abscessus]QSM03230.1 hypothetical protein PROPHIGD102-2_26 [Mycobacterium phage prophi102-2]QSM04000.1 hypothetical protein PROPHIGD54-1_26 [Mycobacterium phage prophiGD54-1]MBE5420173.1 hypothetical protein [Mycobacteroides abscessus]MBE5455128.1 hypothetical protein [Mycobacteroides abscessus]MBN7296729.1 hypothetical protein [Mycobacteroides abscessus subsp. abscessus]
MSAPGDQAALVSKTPRAARSHGAILLDIAHKLQAETDMAERLALVNARDRLLRAMGIEPQITILGEAS